MVSSECLIALFELLSDCYKINSMDVLKDNATACIGLGMV